jgi:N-acetylglutamate synthase-like GNAT family acetyltransferase
MIRAATLDDIPALLDMGRKFADEAGVTARVGWDDKSVSDMLYGLIESEDGIVMVSDKGMIGGYVASHPFNRAVRMFVELFWRAEDGQGLALLNAAEAQAEALGATKSVMVAMGGMERTTRLYSRLGYTLCEAQYIKDIG